MKKSLQNCRKEQERHPAKHPPANWQFSGFQNVVTGKTLQYRRSGMHGKVSMGCKNRSCQSTEKNPNYFSYNNRIVPPPEIGNNVRRFLALTFFFPSSQRNGWRLVLWEITDRGHITPGLYSEDFLETMSVSQSVRCRCKAFAHLTLGRGIPLFSSQFITH